MVSAEWSWKMTKEAMATKRQERIDRVEEKFRDFFEEISNQMLEATMNGDWSIRVRTEDKDFTEEDWDEIAWYLRGVMHYNITWKDYTSRKGMYISWYEKEE